MGNSYYFANRQLQSNEEIISLLARSKNVQYSNYMFAESIIFNALALGATSYLSYMILHKILMKDKLFNQKQSTVIEQYSF